MIMCIGFDYKPWIILINTDSGMYSENLCNPWQRIFKLRHYLRYFNYCSRESWYNMFLQSPQASQGFQDKKFICKKRGHPQGLK